MKRVDIRYKNVIKSIYESIDSSNCYEDSTVKTLVSIAFYNTGLNMDINDCVIKMSSVLEKGLKIFHQIKSFDTFENVLELYEKDNSYTLFVDACIAFIEDKYLTDLASSNEKI